MDSKERHELKDNDLAEFLENFGAFWNRHGNAISTVFFVAVVAWVLWFGLPALDWYGLQSLRKTSAQTIERTWGDLAVITTPQGYRELARETKGHPGVEYVSLLRGAEAYHEEALKITDQQTEEDSDVMSPEESLASAMKMYKEVLDAKDAAVPFKANAAAGLANVSETMKDFDAAKQYWTQAQQLAEQGRLSALEAEAKARLRLVTELARPIVFKDDAEFTPPPGAGDADDKPADATTDKPTDKPAGLVPDLLPGEAPGPGDAQPPANPG